MQYLPSKNRDLRETVNGGAIRGYVFLS